jgi:uncharacterized membrane protein YcaP (DUF421 family)
MGFEEIFGLGVQPRDLSTLQVCARAIVVLISALIMVKLAHKRFMAKKTAFEYVLGFILASILARAINGSSPLIPSIAAGFLLVGTQWAIAGLACKFRSWEWLVKGRTVVLVENGEVKEKAMRKSDLSMSDLQEDLRLEAKTEKVQDVQLATLERNGEISVMRKPRVALIKVENGVQFVRVEIDG